MNILGYIAYAALIFLSVTWTLGVRVKLGTGVHTIFGALFFLASAIFVGVSGVNKLHSLWLIPTGFILSMLSSLLAVHFPPLFHLIKFLSSVFAVIVRIGIPTSKIKAAQDAALSANISETVTLNSLM